MPKWDGELWTGRSEIESIVRKQSNEVIHASNPVFDEYVAMTYTDLRKLFVIMQSCKEWRPGIQMMGAQETMDRFMVIFYDIEDARKAERVKD